MGTLRALNRREVLWAWALAVAIASACGGSGGDRGAPGADPGRSSSSGSGDDAAPGPGGSGDAAGSTSSGGSSSSSSGAGSASTSGSGSSGGTAGDSGSCLGSAALSALGRTHLLIGGSMQDATAAMAPFDLRYDYISGGLFDGPTPCTSCATGCTTGGGASSCSNSGSGCAWWGCWQYDQDPPGEYVRTFESTCAKASPAQIPMITYYEILQASGVAEGSAEVTSAAQNESFMARYFADWRFLLQQIGQTVAILHIEPDFWGYAEQYATTHSTTATSMTAAVASANSTDCGSLPNTIAGMGQCMIAMVRKYAPHALVGLHASAWSTNIDVAGNTDASLDVAGEAAKTAAFLAACGESSADLVIVETSDRDAGYYQVVENKNTWWDATNATLPDFHQDFAWVTALTEGLSKPALYWQTPLGNANQNNTANHYQDNRVAYFFGHTSELAAAHAIGAAFGAGASDQTTPESDGGYFVMMAKAYFSSAGGGQALCP